MTKTRRKRFVGYCPKGFQDNFNWQKKKNILGKETEFLWLYLSRYTPLGDKTGFSTIKVIIEELPTKGKKERGYGTK